jgi:hypothetical protein
VERIDHDRDAIECADEPRLVAGMGIDGHGRHGIQPSVIATRQPRRHGRGAAASCDIEQTSPFDVDEAGDVRRVRRCRRPQERRLVQAQGGDRRLGDGVDQLSAVISDRGHHRVPGDAEITGDTSNRVALLADPPAHVSSCPAGEGTLDELASLGPGGDLTVDVTTSPTTLGPPQTHWTAE